MHRTLLVPLLLAGLAACTTAPQGGSADLAADERLCAEIETGSPTAQSMAACSRVIENTDERRQRVIALNRRGTAWNRLGEESKALADFDQAIRLEPLYSAPYSNRANVYDQQGKHDLAEQNHQAAIRVNPTNSSSYNNYSWHLAGRGDYEGALVQVNRALALNAERQSVYDTQAHAFMGLGEVAEAEAAFTRAMELGGVETVRQYQRALSKKGYDPGHSDGEADAAMRAGLQACIRDNCRLMLD